MLKVFYILDRCFCTTILDWTVFRLRNLDAIVILYLFCLCIHLWSQYLHHLEAIQFISNVNWLIGLCVIWTLWSRCIILPLHMFYLFYLSIYLFYVIFAIVYWYYQFYCLLLLILLLLIHFLIHFIAAVPVHLCILLFYRLSELCCSCYHCLLEPYYSFAIITLYLFLLLFSLLTHCVSYSSYGHCYFYDLALVLLVWLLILYVIHKSNG